MLDRVITRKDLLDIVGRLARTHRIVGPVRHGDRCFYEQVLTPAVLALDFNYCVFGPKAFLLPPHETLFTFDLSRRKFRTEVRFDEKPTVLFGVHPCDINAVRLLDHVFANGHRDEHYLRRRAQTLIVGIDCGRPCTEGVFCADMHANECAEGFDLMCYALEVGENAEARYGVIFGTSTGRELVVYEHVGAPPTAADERAFDRYRAQKKEAFPKEIPENVETLPDLLGRSYDSLLWEATARRCYSCGSCNLTCPTCYCFDCYDETDMTFQRGERKREWDACQLRGFTQVAGGHNFRQRAAARLRHRMFRKGKWIYEREGIPGCVGCARCDRACTAKINSVEIYRQLAEEA